MDFLDFLDFEVENMGKCWETCGFLWIFWILMWKKSWNLDLDQPEA